MGLVLLAGCSSKIAEVHGRVSVGGAPLSDAIVYFVPASGPQAEAMLSADGQYELATPGRGNGVPRARTMFTLADNF